MSTHTPTETPYPCWSCGNQTLMHVVARAHVNSEIEVPHGPPLDSATLYQIMECPNCSAKALRSSEWHDLMDHEGELSWRLACPPPGAFESAQSQRQEQADRHFMGMAVAEAAKSQSEDGKASPLVGAVVARGLDLVAAAYRGELKSGEHAEFTLLEGKCSSEALAGATVYTTLEPCTKRSAGKTPCLDRLRQRRVRRVVVGMLDPNETIRGLGILGLRQAGIQVDLFPVDLMAKLEEMNRSFIADQSSRVGGEREDRAAILNFLGEAKSRLPHGFTKALPSSADGADLSPFVREAITSLANRRDQLQQRLAQAESPSYKQPDGPDRHSPG